MLRTLICIALASVLISSTAWSQATVEYGTTVSKSALGVKGPGASAAGKVSNRLSDALGRSSEAGPVLSATQPQDAKAAEDGMKANRQKLGNAAGTAGAVLHIGVMPTKTTVLIDGIAVAYAPADLRTPAGKHIVELTHPAFLRWRQELSLVAGQELRLQPKLELRDKRFIFLSFED